jgi:hypothetical protein
MKNIPFISTFALCVALPSVLTAATGVYGDIPDQKHAWGVHDRNRPNPAKVTAGAEYGKPPSDAVVLFDGSEESFKKNWKHKRDVRKADWIVRGGAIESVKGAGYLQTISSFGDCQLHIEWASPAKVEGVGQGRGNSGVFLMGNYEIQVLDSYETDPSKSPNPNPNYADGQASAVYAENPPLVNACRAPGEWQTYDIVFHQPVWDGLKMVHPGSVTVFHNGVLTQDHWEMEGLTTHRVRRPLAPHATKLPLELQDHGNPVRFRNIWIREIPSRYANRTHGGPAVDENAVMALRRETAARLFAKIEKPVKPTIANMQALGEVISYARENEYEKVWKDTAMAFHDVLDKMTDDEWNADRKALLELRNSLDTLIRNGAVRQACGTRIRINAAALRLGWEK